MNDEVEEKDPALTRAWELMNIVGSELPPIALMYRDNLASRSGVCMEVFMTAFACYAQVIEGAKCSDTAYVPSPHEVEIIKGIHSAIEEKDVDA